MADAAKRESARPRGKHDLEIASPKTRKKKLESYPGGQPSTALLRDRTTDQQKIKEKGRVVND